MRAHDSKAILVFRLDTLDGERDLRIALDSERYLHALQGFREELRRLRKYGTAEDVHAGTVEHVEQLFLDEIKDLDLED